MQPTAKTPIYLPLIFVHWDENETPLYPALYKLLEIFQVIDWKSESSLGLKALAWIVNSDCEGDHDHRNG